MLFVIVRTLLIFHQVVVCVINQMFHFFFYVTFLASRYPETLQSALCGYGANKDEMRGHDICYDAIVIYYGF